MKKIKKISLIIDCDFEYNEREDIYIHPEGGYILSQSCGVWINGPSTTRTASSNGTYSFEVEDYAGNLKTVSIAITNIDKELPSETILKIEK